MNTQNVSQNTTRTGWTLIEVMFAVTMTSVVLTATGVLLQAIMLAEAGARKDLELSHNLDRLGQQFRNDVHSAVQIHTETSTQTSHRSAETMVLEEPPGPVGPTGPPTPNMPQVFFEPPGPEPPPVVASRRQLVLVIDDTTQIKYHILQETGIPLNRLHRERWEDGRVVHRDIYRLPEGLWGEVSEITLEAPGNGENSHGLAALVIVWRPVEEPTTAKERQWRIEAAIGFHDQGAATN